MTLKHSRAAELVAQALTILSFVSLCWVAHRSLQPRTQCVNSPFLSFVQIEDRRIPNCLYENKLSFSGWTDPVPAAELNMVRALEVLEPLQSFLNDKKLRLAVDLQTKDPGIFELGKGYVRLGTDWLKDPVQVRRALVMGVLRTEFPETYTNQFQLEVVTDFLLLSVFNFDEWKGEDGRLYSLARDMKFSTTAPSFDQYCLSPFKSLSHQLVCGWSDPVALGLDANVWGFRPLLAVSLYRVYQKLGIGEKLHMLNVLKSGVRLPKVNALDQFNAEGLVTWFELTLSEHLQALTRKTTEATAFAVKRTLKELEVESPTHWELTIDVTNTPAWREILEQIRQRSQILKRERVLVFTPEGARALPSGLPVAWSADEISSQKHVLIACEWPRPEDTVHIRARHMFAEQSCGKLTRPFWD